MTMFVIHVFFEDGGVLNFQNKLSPKTMTDLPRPSKMSLQLTFWHLSGKMNINRNVHNDIFNDELQHAISLRTSSSSDPVLELNQSSLSVWPHQCWETYEQPIYTPQFQATEVYPMIHYNDICYLYEEAKNVYRTTVFKRKVGELKNKRLYKVIHISFLLMGGQF